MTDLTLTDPFLYPVFAAAVAWIVFMALRYLSRAELGHWLSVEQADLVLANPTLWRMLAFLLAGAEVLVVLAIQGQWPSFGVSLAMGALAGALTLAAMIDIRCRLLPDRITGVLVGLGVFASLLGLSVPPAQATLGGLIGYGMPWLLTRLIAKRRRTPPTPVEDADSATPETPMGRGDFALIAALGVWLGFSSLPLVLVLASLSMLPVVAWGMLKNGWHRATAIPFGPALAFAGLVLLPWTNFGLIDG